MRVTVFGTGPWPLEGGAVTGPSIRTRQFVEPLIAAGLDVSVVLLENAARNAVPIAGATLALAMTPETILDQGAAEAAIGESDYYFGVGSLMPAVAACRAGAEAHVLADLFGDPLAELHALTLRTASPDLAARDHIWKFQREVLLRADYITTVSSPQRHAVLGQLALLGGLWNDESICSRVIEVPCGVPEPWLEARPLPPWPDALKALGLAPGASYVFFGGSLNAWLDEETIGHAVRNAMRSDPGVHFVASGIPVSFHSEMIEKGMFAPLQEFKGRCHYLAPGRASEDALLAHAGACICLDRDIPESALGSRNRLLAMVRWGARPVCTRNAEVSRQLADADLADAVATGDAECAAKALLAGICRSPQQREADRMRGLDWLRRVAFGETMKPLVSLAKEGMDRRNLEPAGLLDKWAALPEANIRGGGEGGLLRRFFGR